MLVERLQSQASRAGQAMDASRQSSTITLTQIEAAQHALGQIVGAVQTIRGMTNQIATAAEEQSQVAEDMNKSLTRIAQVADEAASVTHDTAASGNTIMQSMNGLKTLTGRFAYRRDRKVRRGGAADSAPLGASARAWTRGDRWINPGGWSLPAGDSRTASSPGPARHSAAR